MKEIYLSEEFFENSNISIMILNEERTILNANPATSRMTGYTLDEIIGNHLSLFRSNNENVPTHNKNWDILIKDGYIEHETWNRKKNGELYLINRSSFKIFNEKLNKHVYVTFSRDITHEKNIEEEYKKLMYTDPLTNLRNHYVFRESLERSLKIAKKKKQKVALIFVDLNRFNKINESFGYAMGDQLLNKVARRLEHICGDDISLSRLHGDLFAFYIPNYKHETSIVSLLEEISENFKVNPFKINDQDIFLTVCMGVSLFPIDSSTSEEMYRNADLAKSRTKEGENETYQFYNPSLNVQVFEKLVLESHLRKAIKNNELVLFYQPQFDLILNKISGVEALIRWNHPEFGLIPPAKFITIAEESGLIIDIGEWVIKEACRQGKVWHDMGYELTIAVNLSLRQFKQKNLLHMIQNTLESSNFNPHFFELEITESVMMDDVEETIKKLTNLRKLGISLSIDDFGTGYSSLSYLVKLPIQFLKVDRSFVQNVTTNKTDATVTSTIIAMANELGLDVVAEGVEEIEQIEFLKNQNCHYYQGFYLSRPIPADELLNMLKQERS